MLPRPLAHPQPTGLRHLLPAADRNIARNTVQHRATPPVDVAQPSVGGLFTMKLATDELTFERGQLPSCPVSTVSRSHALLPVRRSLQQVQPHVVADGGSQHPVNTVGKEGAKFNRSKTCIRPSRSSDGPSGDGRAHVKGVQACHTCALATL